LLRNAAGLLFPIDWPEPFGLVMIEAMACGTPVIAYPCGSVPEVVEHGVTGFIVENRVEAVKAVQDLGFVDRRSVRKTFEKRFTCERMVRSYLTHYQNLASGTAQRADTSISVGESGGQEGIGTTDRRGRRLLPRLN